MATLIPITPNIEQLWSWIHGYRPWLVQLRLAFADFGRDTGLVDRQGTEVRVGDILSGNQHNFIWSGGSQGGGSPDINCHCRCAPDQTAGLTPQEWAKLKRNTPRPWPPENPYLDPHIDPWNIHDPHTVELPERTCHSYFVYPDPVKGIVGRTFFSCERSFCLGKEKEKMYLTSFEKVVYIGNINDTPEQFQLNHSSDADTGLKPPIYFVQKANEERFR